MNHALDQDIDQDIASIRRVLDKRLFFVVGTEKSGTTWLQLLLDRHPHAACRGEGQFATQLWPRLGRALEEYNQFIQGLNAKVFGEIASFPLLDSAAIQSVQTFAAGQLLAVYGDSPELVAVGEKTPGHIRQLDALRQVFPDAGFIFITRDGRDIAVSGWYHLIRQYGEGMADPLPDYARRIAKIWRSDNTHALAFMQAHPDACVQVRYEDLHAQPEAETARLFRFLGLDSSAEIVRECVEACRFDRLAHGRERGQEDARSHFRKGIVGDWRNHFDEKAWSVFDAEAGDLLAQLGYERAWPGPVQSVLSPAPPKPAVSAHIASVRVIKGKNASPQAQLDAAIRLADSGRTEQAIATYQALLHAHPDFALGWRLFGMTLSKLDRVTEAVAAMRASLALEDDIPTRNALVIALETMGARDQALIEGLRTLERKDEAAMRAFAESPFREHNLGRVKRPFDARSPQRNIIAFSLWGDEATYVQGAIANARIAPHIYYGWTTRFYCDSSVPAEVLTELRQLGAQVVMLEDPAWTKIRPLWRFLVSDDPNVNYFLCRDTDSRLNCQELIAVEDWLRSGLPFHAMRDHVYHMELILAGMWGGMAGVLPKLREHIFACPRYFNSRFGDQAFLMQDIWPLVRDHIRVHDSYYRFRGAIDFPSAYRLPRPVHVGGAVKLPPG